MNFKDLIESTLNEGLAVEKTPGTYFSSASPFLKKLDKEMVKMGGEFNPWMADTKKKAPVRNFPMGKQKEIVAWLQKHGFERDSKYPTHINFENYKEKVTAQIGKDLDFQRGALYVHFFEHPKSLA